MGRRWWWDGVFLSLDMLKLNSPAHRYLCLRFKRHLAMPPARLKARMDSLLSFPVGLFHPLQHAGCSENTPLVFMTRGEREARSSKFYPGALRIADEPSGIGTHPLQCVRAIIARIDGAYLGHQTRAVRDRIASRSGRHG